MGSEFVERLGHLGSTMGVGVSCISPKRYVPGGLLQHDRIVLSEI